MARKWLLTARNDTTPQGLVTSVRSHQKHVLRPSPGHQIPNQVLESVPRLCLPRKMKWVTYHSPGAQRGAHAHSVLSTVSLKLAQKTGGHPAGLFRRTPHLWGPALLTGPGLVGPGVPSSSDSTWAVHRWYQAGRCKLSGASTCDFCFWYDLKHDCFCVLRDNTRTRCHGCRNEASLSVRQPGGSPRPLAW